jgi:hypothetical protein
MDIYKAHALALDCINELMEHATIHREEKKLTQWDIETMLPNELIVRSREIAIESKSAILLEVVNRYSQCCQTKKI